MQSSKLVSPSTSMIFISKKEIKNKNYFVKQISNLTLEKVSSYQASNIEKASRNWKKM